MNFEISKDLRIDCQCFCLLFVFLFFVLFFPFVFSCHFSLFFTSYYHFNIFAEINIGNSDKNGKDIPEADKKDKNEFRQKPVETQNSEGVKREKNGKKEKSQFL